MYTYLMFQLKDGNGCIDYSLYKVSSSQCRRQYL